MMKPWSSIFAIAPDCHAANTGHYAALWRTHFYEGIVAAGATLTIPTNIDYSWSYDTSTAPISADVERTHDQLRTQLWRAIDANRVDAVISYARSRQIDPALVRETEKRGIPWINFFCDSLSQFDEVRELAAIASLNWFPESAAAEKYRALGRPTLRQSYALNSAALPSVVASIPTRPVVGFVGLPSANRVTMLSLLSMLGCPLEIHGYGWDKPESAAFGGQSSWRDKLRRAIWEPHRLERIWRRLGWKHLHRRAQGPLDEAGMRLFLDECRIILGLNDTRTPEGRLESYLKFRDIEMPAHGCCYLTQHNPDIAALLESGKEVLTFRSVAEAYTAIRHHLRHPDLCRRIGLAAHERILREHTWPVRLRELQAALDGKQT